MFLERRFEQAIGRIFGNGAVPLRLKLWNGRRIDLSPAPTVTVIVPKMSALRYFISPDLNKLGEAFVEGHIRVEGSIHDIFRVAESLARNVAARAGFATPKIKRAIRFRSRANTCTPREARRAWFQGGRRRGRHTPALEPGPQEDPSPGSP